MIRVSVEAPDNQRYRLKPIVDLRQRFIDDGILVGFELRNPDLRVVHHDIAIRDLENSPDKRLATPVIVDERIDGAQVVNSVAVRSAMAHPDVKFWLKRNTFRDWRLNNAGLVADRYHYQVLNDIAEFHFDVTEHKCVMPVTADMAAKIRLLPTVSCDLFKVFRDQEIDWNQKRPIDVSFAGLVDYEVRGTDYWDGKLAAAHAATVGGIRFLPDLHRRAAVQQLAKLRHLRVLIGMNRALQPDLYEASMMRSSISVSPWGFGEYAYRDYQSILAGCVMVKPPTDHVETFAPDIYQAGKYYVACKADFSDLPEVVEGIMSDRSKAIELARRARKDMLEANTPERVHAYYLQLFRQALGEDLVDKAVAGLARRGAALSLAKGPVIATRSEVRGTLSAASEVGAASSVVFVEDHSAGNTHDIRLLSADPVPAGLYRVRLAVRKQGRSHCAIQLHLNFKEQIWLDIDLDACTARIRHTNGDLFRVVFGPELSETGDGWTVVTLAIHVTEFIETGVGLVLYAADGNNSSYDGDGRAALAVSALDLMRMDMQTWPADAAIQ